MPLKAQRKPAVLTSITTLFNGVYFNLFYVKEEHLLIVWLPIRSQALCQGEIRFHIHMASETCGLQAGNRALRQLRTTFSLMPGRQTPIRRQESGREIPWF